MRQHAGPVLLVICLACTWTATADRATELLSATGVKGGLVVHVGCGDGTLTAALRLNEAYVVHGLDRDAASVAQARRHIETLDLYGPVSVDMLEGKQLPYVDNLANLVVAPDLCVAAIGTLHPYERGGSYFVDGIAGLLGGPRGADLRSRVAFVLVPVGNPDGTAHGTCKRTPTGCNLTEKGNRSAHPTACALRGLLCGVAAAAARSAYVDAHNWMIRHDGVTLYSGELVDAMREELVGDLFPSGCAITDRSDLHAGPDTTDLRVHAARTLGMATMVTPTPWYGRMPDDMRRLGAFVTQAFVKALL
jgi:hypothetical protein